MSIAYVDSPMTWDDVRRIWRELGVPEGWRPEVTITGISMTPPPGGAHNLIADLVHRRLLPAVPDGNAHHDRNKKKWAYAHGAIPQYLLIDSFDEDGPAVSLFTEPDNGVYSKTSRVAFGQPVTLGEPFGIALATDEF